MKEFGTKLYYGVAASGTAATQIAGIRKIDSMPGLDFETYDDSLIDQTSLVKDWEATMINAGNLGATLKCTHVQYAAMLALHDGSKRSWKITFASLNTLVFDGRLIKLDLMPGGGSNAHVDIKIEIIVTSLPVAAAAP